MPGTGMHSRRTTGPRCSTSSTSTCDPGRSHAASIASRPRRSSMRPPRRPPIGASRLDLHYVYVVCEAFLPGSFAAAAASGHPRTWMELLFLSFTTLSGVGLGDIVPVVPMARALVMIEEFTGVMYLA